MSLQTHDLENRQALLDKREELLKKGETELRIKLAQEEVLEQRIAVLNKQIATRRNLLSDVAKNHEEQLQRHKQQSEDLQQDIIRLKDKVASKHEELKGLEAKRVAKIEDLHNLQLARQSVNADIKQNNDYLVDQESTVNKAVADWNAQLTSFADEAKAIELKKKDLLRDTLLLEQKQQDLVEQVETSQIRLEFINNKCVEELKVTETAIQAKQSELQSLENKAKATMQGLASHEKAIKLLETTLNKREVKLRQRERYLDSRLSLT